MKCIVCGGQATKLSLCSMCYTLSETLAHSLLEREEVQALYKNERQMLKKLVYLGLLVELDKQIQECKDQLCALEQSSRPSMYYTTGSEYVN